MQRCLRLSYVAATGSSSELQSATVGYGPFSAIAKARVACEKKLAAAPGDPTVQRSTAEELAQLETNINLRRALADLAHPTQLASVQYQSPEWRKHMVRLYRVICRLHNKPVAVSLKESISGPEAAVATATGIRAAEAAKAQAQAAADTSEVAGISTGRDDYLLRYLLTTEQREFGNRFVQSEFSRHMDADARSAEVFYASWYDYILQLSSGVTSRDISESERRLLTGEQQEKLRELREKLISIRGAHNPYDMP